MRCLALVLLSLASLQAEPNPEDLLQRAHSLVRQKTGRADAEQLLRQAITIWDRAPDPNGLDGDAQVFLSLLYLGKDKDPKAMQSDVQPLISKALSIYENLTPPVSGNRLALALEIEALVLRAAHDDEQARKVAERAKSLRSQILTTMQIAAEPAEIRPRPSKIGGVVTPPAIVHKVEPAYSEEARLAKLQGNAALSIIVEADGTPSTISLVHSLGFGLDEQAYRAVSQWRFTPGMKDGEPVRVFATIEVNFRLL